MGKKNIRPAKATVLRGIFDFYQGDFEPYHAMIKELSEEYFYSKDNMEKELGRTYNSNPDGKTSLPTDIDPRSQIKETKRNYKKWVDVLIYKYGIPPHFFSDLDQIYENGYITQPITQTYSLEEGTEAHEVLVNHHYNDLKTDFLVMDNLVRQSFENILQLQNYLKGNEACFNHIIEIAKEYGSDFQYIRIMTLPPTYNFTQKSEYDILKDALDHTSLPLFKHICDYLELQKKFKPKPDKPCGFFVPTRIVASDHFALGKSGKLIVSETGVYDPLGNFKPLLLDVQNPGSSEIKNKVYLDLILSLIDEPETLEINDLSLIHKCITALVEDINSLPADESLRSVDKRKALRHEEISGEKLQYISELLS